MIQNKDMQFTNHSKGVNLTDIFGATFLVGFITFMDESQLI